MCNYFDPSERAAQKQASRDQDAKDLADGTKSPEQLRKESGKFSFPDAQIDWSEVYSKFK